MEQIVFRTKGLSFGTIINYQDIQIYGNKVNFIVGSSGSGKSTLLKLFNATLAPERGEIWYCDKNLSETDTIELRKEVSLVSQSVYLFDQNIRDNFRLYYEFREMPAPSQEDMKYYLDLCCIPFSLDKDCTTMSGGEKQRVYLAIFLSFKPRVIMLDEPTSALDQENSRRMIGNVIDYCRSNGITIIVVSHDKSITEEFAEHTITIGRGEA
jgi:putative ABC transport system ATP-binding protein